MEVAERRVQTSPEVEWEGGEEKGKNAFLLPSVLKERAIISDQASPSSSTADPTEQFGRKKS